MRSNSASRAGRFTDLRVRTASALAIAALAFVCVYAGGVWSTLLAVVACGAMAYEWRSITAHAGAPPGRDALTPAIGVSGAVLLAHFADPGTALLWLGALAVVAAVVDLRSSRVGPLWGCAGVLYIGVAGVAFVALRGYEPFGFLSIVWVALTVVAADVGGYFAGRMIGGPKLWPVVSPKKTWAGLAGGVGLAFIVGGLFSWATTGTYFYQVCTVSSLAALLAQGGDLAESALKRHFSVKDSGTLIPGHGGVLDRLDGHMAATLVASAVTFARGQTVFIW